METVQLFIDGERCDAVGGETYESVNPATEAPWATVAAGRPADIDRAVAAAWSAHRSGVWRDRSPTDRAAVLRRLADMLIEKQDVLSLAEVQDGGGTFRKANTADIPAAMQTFQYYADLAESCEWEREDAT